MGREPGLSRLATWLFAAALLVTLAELGWWTWFNLRNTARERRDHLERIEAQVALADGLQSVLRADAERLGFARDAAQSRAQDLLRPHFPELSFDHGEITAAQVGIALLIEQRFVTHVRMFVAEGVVFALLLMLGGYLVVRSLQHELTIVRQTSNFVAAITHELKSPLASLRLWVETLERHPPATHELGATLQIMQADIDRLDTLIGNVLTAARLESAPAGAEGSRRYAGSVFDMAPSKTPTGQQGFADSNSSEIASALDVAQSSRSIVANFEPRAASLGLTLHLVVDSDDLPFIAMAPSAYELVLRNLIDNAIKYSGSAKNIDIALRCEGPNVVLRVSDFGIGLAAEELQRIFRKFYRVGDEMVRQSQGTGLGLFLVRAVMREHGGTIEACSAGLGRGSTFVVTLPSHGARLSSFDSKAGT